MGSKNPDRMADPVIPAAARTIGDMKARSWQVVSRCPKCSLVMRVNLDDLIKLRGADLVLWNRHPPCRRMDCGGKVVFSAAGGPGAAPFKPLVIDGWNPARAR